MMNNTFEPTSDFFNNPYPLYRRMLNSPEPFWLPHKEGADTPGIWLFSRYQEAVEILRLPADVLSKEIRRALPDARLGPVDLTMMNMDPPNHTRLRNLAGQAFSPTIIRELEPRMGAIADSLIDGLLDRESGDFVRDFAMPLPVTVITEMMAVPEADREQMLDWVFMFLTGIDSIIKDTEVVARQRDALGALMEYFAHLVEIRKKSPGNDLVSTLIAAQAQSQEGTAQELLGMCAFLLVTGHETTVNLLASGLYTLLRHPEQLERLRRQPDLMPTAIEEMLRYESPFQRSSFRITVAPCEIAGKRLAAGEQVGAVIGAANRDPAEFSNPDRFDIARTPNRHLAFGSGIHACLGATMARIEARIAFSRLIARVPDIQLAGDITWKHNTVLRGLASLPVEY
jgi:cytochrome P450